MNLIELNKAQRQAVLTTSPKVLVMAGAGTGKTKVLTTRICHLITQGVNEADICAFTFTNKAAREMKTRVNHLLGKETKTIISTFHSYCYSFISDPIFYPKLGFTQKPTLITDTDKAKIIKRILTEFNTDYNSIPFLSAISKIKNRAPILEISYEDRQLLNRVYQTYQQILIQSNSLDYDDMIPLFLKLTEDKEIEDMLQYPYVLIDECQDTNQIQYDLVQVLAKKYQNIYMVGDENQCIYSFRNSTLSILKDFELQADEVILLTENYRSTKTILKKANTLIQHNQNQTKKDLLSNLSFDYPVSYKEYDTTIEEAHAVVQEIKNLIALYQIPLNDIAILYRNNIQSLPIERELKTANLPYILYGGKPFFEYKEIKAILYTYRFILNPRNEIAFGEIYNKPSPNIEAYEYQDFIKNYHNQAEDIISFLKIYQNPKFQNLGKKLSHLQELMPILTPEDFYKELLKTLHYYKYLDESNQKSEEYLRIYTLRDIIKTIPKECIEDEINQILLDTSTQNSKASISLLTIHKAKGLEFNTVFVIGLNDGILPSPTKTIEALEEERRLAYVAMTRAKERLYLSSAYIHYTQGKKFKHKPSIFIEEADLNQKFLRNYWYNHSTK